MQPRASLPSPQNILALTATHPRPPSRRAVGHRFSDGPGADVPAAESTCPRVCGSLLGVSPVREVTVCVSREEGVLAAGLAMRLVGSVGLFVRRNEHVPLWIVGARGGGLLQSVVFVLSPVRMWIGTLYLDILASRGPADRIVPRAVSTESHFHMELPLGRWVHDGLGDEPPSIRTPEFVAAFRRMSSSSRRCLRIYMVSGRSGVPGRRIQTRY